VTSAFASASTMISTEIPFSRSMFSSASIISEFMASLRSSRRSPRCLRRLARLASRSPLEHGVAGHDVVIRDTLVHTVGFDLDAEVVGRLDHHPPPRARALALPRLQRDGC